MLFKVALSNFQLVSGIYVPFNEAILMSLVSSNNEIQQMPKIMCEQAVVKQVHFSIVTPCCSWLPWQQYGGLKEPSIVM